MGVKSFSASHAALYSRDIERAPPSHKMVTTLLPGGHSLATRAAAVTFTPDELKALDLESSKVIDLETFVPRGEVDPVYFNSLYYLYPDGQMAVEATRVIGAAMAETGVVGIGRLTMSRRERMVMVDPRGTGMVLITLRAADEVRAPQFTSVDGAIDAEMLAIARAIIAQRIA